MNISKPLSRVTGLVALVLASCSQPSEDANLAPLNNVSHKENRTATTQKTEILSAGMYVNSQESNEGFYQISPTETIGKLQNDDGTPMIVYTVFESHWSNQCFYFLCQDGYQRRDDFFVKNYTEDARETFNKAEETLEWAKRQGKPQFGDFPAVLKYLLNEKEERAYRERELNKPMIGEDGELSEEFRLLKFE